MTLFEDSKFKREARLQIQNDHAQFNKDFRRFAKVIMGLIITVFVAILIFNGVALFYAINFLESIIK